VALALQSCLGGTAPGFHVNFQSHNHYRFSVANKKVGFLVYGLRRFIAKNFDVYFYLWHNGTPNWEREKRLWEEEQAHEWTLVRSKQSQCASRSIPKQNKRVHFAENWIMRSPPVKHQPVFQSV